MGTYGTSRRLRRPYASGRGIFSARNWTPSVILSTGCTLSWRSRCFVDNVLTRELLKDISLQEVESIMVWLRGNLRMLMYDVYRPTPQAREATLQETQAVEARRAARVCQLAGNPPKIYKRDWSPCEPFPHRFGVFFDARAPTQSSASANVPYTVQEISRRRLGSLLRPLRNALICSRTLMAYNCCISKTLLANSPQVTGVEVDADIAQEVAWGQDTSCKARHTRRPTAPLRILDVLQLVWWSLVEPSLETLFRRHLEEETLNGDAAHVLSINADFFFRDSATSPG